MPRSMRALGAGRIAITVAFAIVVAACGLDIATPAPRTPAPRPSPTPGPPTIRASTISYQLNGGRFTLQVVVDPNDSPTDVAFEYGSGSTFDQTLVMAEEFDRFGLGRRNNRCGAGRLVALWASHRDECARLRLPGRRLSTAADPAHSRPEPERFAVGLIHIVRSSGGHVRWMGRGRPQRLEGQPATVRPDASIDTQPGTDDAARDSQQESRSADAKAGGS